MPSFHMSCLNCFRRKGKGKEKEGIEKGSGEKKWEQRANVEEREGKRRGKDGKMRKLVLSLFVKSDEQQECKCIHQTQKFLFYFSRLAKYWRKSCVVSLCFRISLSVNEMRKLMLVPLEGVWDVTKTSVGFFFRENVNNLEVILIWESGSIYHFYYQIYLRMLANCKPWVYLQCEFAWLFLPARTHKSCDKCILFYKGIYFIIGFASENVLDCHFIVPSELILNNKISIIILYSSEANCVIKCSACLVGQDLFCFVLIWFCCLPKYVRCFCQRFLFLLLALLILRPFVYLFYFILFFLVNRELC